ncbi:toll/interleukin-1 receptor domain-containing protein [Shewanella algae]|uniref:toll/interleukin-1 receptor domain-containing protein n=1 Tax=Shewanella algae TaxID=38313 RepID=UPI00313BAE45
MNNRKRVFLSYCHADIEVALNIERMLHDDSIEVLNSYNLEPGSNIQTNLKYFVESSDIVLLLLSKAYFNSVYSGKELYEFLDESNKRKVSIIPIAIERQTKYGHPMLMAR